MKVRYQAVDTAGNLVAGQLDAESVDAAREIIWSSGATPISVRPPARTDILLREIRPLWGSGRLDDVDLGRLVRDLAVLLQAGVPLDGALRIASLSTDRPMQRRLALDLLDGVLRGDRLADVMAKGAPDIRREYITIVQAGETSGDHGAAMIELADLIDRRIDIRARIRSAMAYPMFLLCLAGVSLWVVLGLLLPAVTPIFLDNGKALPPVIAILDSVRANGARICIVLAVLVSCVTGSLALAYRQAELRVALDRFWLKIPIVGAISELREAARFTRTLSTMLRAGVPLLQALEATASLAGNRYTRRNVDSAIGEVREGSRLASALSRWSVVPGVAIQILTVGEESGRLQDMLSRAAAILERQEQARTARLLAVLAPGVTILVAALVAAIILSVMSAMLSINELVLT